MTNESAKIFEKYKTLKKEKPKLRARNLADEMKISEGELLACRVGHDGVTRLNDDMEKILAEIIKLDEVMALTRNEACVHERKGIYDNCSFSSQGKMKHGLFVNADIDLRLFMNHWKYSFAVEDLSEKGSKKSLQFFDKEGCAVHKIYLTDKSNEKAFDEIVKNFKSDEQNNSIEIEKYEEKSVDLSDEEIDWNLFRQAWENLKDTHDFFSMLRKFKTGRVQAFRKIGDDFAYEVANDSSRKVLELARDKNCEIMVFVGNRGCIQIHTGPVNKLVEHGDWYNVLDPKFNLHLNEKEIFKSYIVKKPTIDGIVTALEIFDKNEEIIVTFFGKRKPGIPELELWREIISKIEKLKK